MITTVVRYVISNYCRNLMVLVTAALDFLSPQQGRRYGGTGALPPPPVGECCPQSGDPLAPPLRLVPECSSLAFTVVVITMSYQHTLHSITFTVRNVVQQIVTANNLLFKPTVHYSLLVSDLVSGRSAHLYLDMSR